MMEAKRGGNHLVRRRARRRPKAAKALGLHVPSTLIARADEGDRVVFALCCSA
jgi:sarcosine oxidase gamma subunit